MKRLFKRSLSAFLALIIALGCVGMTAFAAEDYDYDDGVWRYKESGTGYSIVKFTGENSGARTIRSDVNSKNIVGIAADVAKDMDGITALTIDKNIESIGAGAFSGCSKLAVVYISSAFDLSAGAFDGTPIIKDGRAEFTYKLGDSYATKEQAVAELDKVFGANTWTFDAESGVFSATVKGYTVKTTATKIEADETAPKASVSVGKNTWTAVNNVSAIYEKKSSEDVKAVISVSDEGNPTSSGLKSVSYFIDNVIYESIKNNDDKFVNSITLDKDGKAEIVLDQTKDGIVYVRAEDNAGNITYVNSDRLCFDAEAPTATLTDKTNTSVLTFTDADYSFAKADFKAYTGPAKFVLKAEDDRKVKAVGYYVVNATVSGDKVSGIPANAEELEKAAQWTELSSSDWKEKGAEFSVSANGKYCVVYIKVVDYVGNVKYVTSGGFVTSDNVAPVITAEYFNAKDVLTSVAFDKDGKSSAVTAPAMRITATDDSDNVKTLIEKKSGDKFTKVAEKASYVIESSGEYRITATDKTNNSTTVYVTLKAESSTAKDSAATIEEWVVNTDGTNELKELEVKNGVRYTTSYPATLKVTDNGKLASVKYSYTDSDKTEKVIDVTDKAVKGVDIKDYNIYTIEIIDNDFSTILCELKITEPTRTITKMDVDTGDATNKTQLTCLGGTFKAAVTGTNIYHKIAMFNGDTMVGKIQTIGAADKPMNTAEIAEGVYNLPANSTAAAVEYVIRYYDADTDDKEITSKTGTEIAKVTVAAKSAAITVEPTELKFTSSGATQDITIHSNCELNVTVSSNNWITLAIKSFKENEDKTLSTVLSVTASTNSGLDRDAVITISDRKDAKNAVSVKVSQTGVGCAERLAGDDRVGTAIEISKFGWTSANTVVLASGMEFADALAGVSLAAAVDGPILLTYNKATGLEQGVLDEIKRLGAKNVYILGGTSAVCADTATTLEKAGLKVERIAGADRYATSVAIAKKVSALTGKEFTKLYFTNAWNYPDALSISSAAAIEGNPILYMPTKGAVEKNVSDYVKTLKCKTGVILGGTAAVSEDGQKSLTALGLTVSRVSGEDRYETSVKINEANKALFTGKVAAVATGEAFPDALAGGALCAKLKMPVVLVSEKNTADALSYLKAKAPESLVIFGGTAAVSETLAVLLATAI